MVFQYKYLPSTLDLLNYLSLEMRLGHLTLLLVLLSTLASASIDGTAEISLKKGMTWKVTTWPSPSSDWAGQMYCNGCDPYNGDTLCSNYLPILCVNFYKTLPRPNYNYSATSGGSMPDKGFYNGWSGAVLTVTKAVRGSDITSYAVGTSYCQKQFGPTSIMAEHHQGRYMPYMTNPPPKIWITWDWSQTTNGGWGMWGYFAHSWKDSAWVWISNQPNGNCN